MDEKQSNQDPTPNKYLYTGKAANSTTLKSFQKAKKKAGILAILALGLFIYLTWLFVPSFFSFAILALPLFAVIMLSKNYGEWVAYTHVRHNSDILADNLEQIEQSIMKADQHVNK